MPCRASTSARSASSLALGGWAAVLVNAIGANGATGNAGGWFCAAFAGVPLVNAIGAISSNGWNDTVVIGAVGGSGGGVVLNAIGDATCCGGVSVSVSDK